MNRGGRATRSNINKSFVPGGVISTFTGSPTDQSKAQPVSIPAQQLPTNNIQVEIQETAAASLTMKNPTPNTTPNPVPAPTVPDIKMELTNASLDSKDTLSESGNGIKRRFSRQQIPKKLKRLRRNRRLRKILTPKNALMSLHELLGTGLSDFTIMPEERGFVATVHVNNVRYDGHGTSKMSAKNNASEKALRDIIIQRMVQAPKAPKSNAEAQSGGDENFHDDIDMVDNGENEDGGEVPMLHLASFALHKLFSEWQSEGFEIPDFKLGTNAPTVASLENMAIDKPVKPPTTPIKRMQVPENANTMHPTTLLCMMRPALKYVDLGSEGQVPNTIHRIGVEIDGKHFIGSAKNKKLARKFAAIDACNHFFGTNFVKDVV